MNKPELVVARCFYWLGLAGLLISLLLFVLYILGVIPSETDAEHSARIWSEPNANIQIEPGDGAGVSTASLALLATVPIATLVILAAVWILHGDTLFAVLSLGVTAVLVTAALGI